MAEQMTIDDVVIETPADEVKAETTEIAEAKQNTKIVDVNNTHNIFGDTNAFKNAWVMAQNLAKSDLVPPNYQGKPMNCLIALDYANRFNISPLFVTSQLYIVKGKAVWSGQAVSALVQNCGLFKNVKVNWVGEKGKDNYGCYISAVRKEDNELLIGTTVDLAMVKGEKWDSNPKWKTMFSQMCVYRAFSMFSRIYCPSVLNGLSTEGEVEDIERNRNIETDNPF